MWSFRFSRVKGRRSGHEGCLRRRAVGEPGEFRGRTRETREREQTSRSQAVRGSAQSGGLRRDGATFRDAFPDLKADIEILLADGDYTVSRFTLSGTHVGEFQSLPAGGKPFRITGTTIMRFQDGRLVELWPEFDTMSPLTQI